MTPRARIAYQRGVMRKITLLSLLSALLLTGLLTGCGDDSAVEDAQWQAYRANQENARLRDELNRKPKVKYVEKKSQPEIFEPVRDTPSTIHDPLYERN